MGYRSRPSKNFLKIMSRPNSRSDPWLLWAFLVWGPVIGGRLLTSGDLRKTMRNRMELVEPTIFALQLVEKFLVVF